MEHRNIYTMNVEESLYKTRGGELEAWWSWSLASLCLQAAVQLLEERSRFCSNFFSCFICRSIQDSGDWDIQFCGLGISKLVVTFTMAQPLQTPCRRGLSAIPMAVVVRSVAAQQYACQDKLVLPAGYHVLYV